MFDFKKKEWQLVIPPTATLLEIIEILNTMKLKFNVKHDDKSFQKWIYEYREWLIEVTSCD